MNTYDIQSVTLDISSLYADIYLDATQFDTSRMFMIGFVKDGAKCLINGLTKHFYVKLSTGVVQAYCKISNNYLYVEFPAALTIDTGKVDYEVFVGNNRIFGTIFMTDFLADFSPLEPSIETLADAAAEAESYAHGSTDTREGEDTDNGMYYYNLIKQDTFGLCYVKDIGFANLADVETHTNYMYKVLNEFTSTNAFVDGGGVRYPAGTYVFYNDSKWDCFNGAGVVGIKGSAEEEYRYGTVELTKYDLGLDYVVNVRFQSATPNDKTEYWFKPF